MTNTELKVLSDLCHDFAVIREEFDKCREELALEKKCHEEVCEEVLQRAEDNKRLEEESLRISETAANAKQTAFDLQQDIFKLTEERDEARRKLGALTLCVGFLKDYDAKHPTRSLEAFKAAVKKCIDDNHIVLTEGGMAK